MIDFTTTSREFRSLVTRRRDLLTFMGSVFAALSIFLQNALQGNLPAPLKRLEAHAFAFIAILLLVPSMILALRHAKLHGGMIINGVFYSRLMQEQSFTRRADPLRSARHNLLGVSFLTFLLADLLAGFSLVVLAMALSLPLWLSSVLGGLLIFVGIALYFRFHRQAAQFALGRIQHDSCAPFDKNEWQNHVAGSLEDANLDMITLIAFVGLVVFSVFESLSGLGALKTASSLDLAAEDVKTHGPAVYSGLMVVVCVLSLVVYIRLRVAVGHLSLQIDPSDRPFRLLRLTDSLLGYILLSFLFAVSLYVLLSTLAPELDDVASLTTCGGAMGLAVVMEQVSLAVADRRSRGAMQA